MYLIFDTETTGLPKRWDAPVSDTDNWPRCVQIAWQLHDEMGGLIEQFDTLVRPEGFNIPYDSEQIHGISTDLALREGKPLDEVLKAAKTPSKHTRFSIRVRRRPQNFAGYRGAGEVNSSCRPLPNSTNTCSGSPLKKPTMRVRMLKPPPVAFWNSSALNPSNLMS